jgi:hypothetical protein
MTDMTLAASSMPLLDADTLKARFKNRCNQTHNTFQNWQIRVHRALSWLKRAEYFQEEQPEAKFLFLWIALNSLYSRWDNGKNAPAYDSSARSRFFDAICEMGADQLAARLRQHRGLIKKILSNPYLSDIFWRNPGEPKGKGHATSDANYIDSNFKNGCYNRVLNQVMQRLYVLRGQIVHGASSGGSRLNRTSLRYCLELLTIFVPVILEIAIEHGCHDDWPELCYPPQP